ncbi:hypothetical protein STEG23_001315 [Scotinomys teguina]
MKLLCENVVKKTKGKEINDVKINQNVSGTKNINTDRDSGSAMDQHKALGSSPDPDVITAPEVANRPLSLQICLSPQDTDHSVSLSLPKDTL